jgi:hypothetical protein
MLDLLMREDGFPEIWMPSSEQRDLRTLLRDRHQWVKIRTRVQNTLQAIALNPLPQCPLPKSRLLGTNPAVEATYFRRRSPQ